jgi:hypothetical protein
MDPPAARCLLDDPDSATDYATPLTAPCTSGCGLPTPNQRVPMLKRLLGRTFARASRRKGLEAKMRIHRTDGAHQGQDLIIGASSGYEYGQIQQWVNSLQRSGYSGDRAVIAYDMAFDAVDELLRRGFQVATFGENGRRRRFYYPVTGFRHADTSIDRFYGIWTFLNDVGRSYRYAGFIDVRDVIFQTDPSAWLEAHLGEHRITVSSEGFSLGDEPWNSRVLLESYGPLVHQHVMSREVFNAGTMAGDATTMRDVALNVFLCSQHNALEYTDQAAFNILLSLEPYRSITRFNPPDEDWACQAATTAPESKYVRTRLQRRFARPPVFDGDVVRTPDGRPYCLVHQYDRVPGWKEHFEQKFAD